MKMTWKKNESTKRGNKRPIDQIRILPFGEDIDDIRKDVNEASSSMTRTTNSCPNDQQDCFEPNTMSVVGATDLAQLFEEQGNNLAEDGEFQEALVKWEAALNLQPERAVLHEQKAQVLLELGEAWKALCAATRATELDPSWAEAWITLGRAQLNFGEPVSAVMSFDKALAIKPESADAHDDKQTALLLLRKSTQLQSTGLCSHQNRFVVQD
ncbi:hypothetical protein LIER_13694 [Lithospermum erythrorhizon]|uniref:Tetratricopeptide repeat protein 33 n=1 Tax=Lithospermum erythrorhizon TaxID=34254 RepID=A0AAV3PWU0_LITER